MSNYWDCVSTEALSYNGLLRRSGIGSLMHSVTRMGDFQSSCWQKNLRKWLRSLCSYYCFINQIGVAALEKLPCWWVTSHNLVIKLGHILMSNSLFPDWGLHVVASAKRACLKCHFFFILGFHLIKKWNQNNLTVLFFSFSLAVCSVPISQIY